MTKSKIKFSGKAETLEALAPILRSARILDQVRFLARDWLKDRNLVLDKIDQCKWISKARTIVRSSASSEDRNSQSLAGHFRTVANVVRDDLASAIDDVVASFGETPGPADAVFLQPMLSVQISGVILTQDPNCNGPYLIINYNSHGDSAAVTGGGGGTQTYVHWRGNATMPPAPLDQLIALASELETLFYSTLLDIEFGFGTDGDLYLFQVRPLAAGTKDVVGLEHHRQLLQLIADKVKDALRPHPFLRGRRTMFGVMPDWNPAEIIGIRPRPLALSLYRNLITDSVWAYQRHNYGYRNLRSFPLMQSLNGLPYIDVRVSFNSFVPSDISDELADRLVDHYIDRLSETPVLHDKVEFEIVHSCYTFDLEDKLRNLLKSGFSGKDLDELSDSLRRLTNRVVNKDDGLWRTDAEKIDYLEERQSTVMKSDMSRLSKIYWLIEDCKRYGTLPFAGLARAAFIAVQMLRSLVSVGSLEPAQVDHFMQSLETVGGRLVRDQSAMSQKDFLTRYGHLRPGTYDLLSPRYDEAPDRYLGNFSETSQPKMAEQTFALKLPQMRQIDKLLKSHQLEMDVVTLFEFFQACIQGREYAKFVFTRSVSNVMSLLTELGSQFGLDRDDMSHFDVSQIAELNAASSNVETHLRTSIATGRINYAKTLQLNLPPLIEKAADVWGFHVPVSQPNFITNKQAEGHVATHDAAGENLKGSILFLPSADPGFDWIFTRQISGFVTIYGGVNSHMAIRAGELGVPAVIGAGETLYNKWSKAQFLRIDAANRQVEIIR